MKQENEDEDQERRKGGIRQEEQDGDADDK